MAHIITRNIFMAFGAWTVVLFDHYDPSYPLWKVALGATLGGAAYCLYAWGQGGEL